MSESTFSAVPEWQASGLYVSRDHNAVLLVVQILG
jgi:hypothetical protein